MSRTLIQNEWFADLPDEVVAQLAAQARRRELAAGQMLYARGDQPEGLYGVVSGRIELRAVSPGGREIIVAVHEAGNWFGEVTLFDGKQRVHDAIADTDVELRVIPHDEFHRWLQAHPDLYPHFIRMLCRKLRIALAYAEDLIFLPLSARLAKRLLALLQAHGQPDGDGQRIDRHLPQDVLARMLSAGRQAVSKELKAFEAQGWIRVAYGRITVLDAEALAVAARVEE